MARLGMDVMILAKIGNDERGEMILQRLEQEGVSISFVKRDPHAPTGTSVLISSHDRDAANSVEIDHSRHRRCDRHPGRRAIKSLPGPSFPKGEYAMLGALALTQPSGTT